MDELYKYHSGYKIPNIFTVFCTYIFELILFVQRNFDSNCTMGDQFKYDTRFIMKALIGDLLLLLCLTQKLI